MGERTRWRAILVRSAAGALILSGAACTVEKMIPSWPGGAHGFASLSAEDGYLITVQVNGKPVRLRVETGYAGIVLNPEAAARVGLKPSIFENDIRVGPVRVQGESSVAAVTLGSSQHERRLVWFDRPITSVADGIINIADLPYERVTLQLRAAGPAEVATVLPMSPEIFWNLTYIQQVGNRKIAVRFLLEAPETLLTAAAGAHLAETHSGKWGGDAFQHPISLQVSRPVRPMKFNSDLSLGSLRIPRALVRTSDLRGKYVLPTEAEVDPNEIVVTGNRATSKASLNAIIGADNLSGCSSISYTRATRQLTLTCSQRS